MKLTAPRLRQVLRYVPTTGKWRWIAKTAPNVNRRFGDVAGHPNRSGYLQITIDKKFYMAHRLAWLYMTGRWPKHYIDHKNRIVDDNRWSNLREATRSQNAVNAKKRASGDTKLKGSYYLKRNKKFAAQIRVDGKAHYLGLFDTAELAHAAYLKAAKQHFGTFTRAA